MSAAQLRLLSLLIFVGSVIFVPGFAGAQAIPPGLVHIEGRLTNASGVPANGATDIVLRLYDTGPGAGGTLLITDSHTGGGAVTVTNGIYAFDLGSGTITAGSKATIGACFADVLAVWLEVQVAAETLTPRTRMVSAAYALNSDTLDGRDSTYFATSSGSAPVGSPYVTVGNDGTLTAERAIAVGLGLASSDGGANGIYTISLDYTNTVGGNPAVAVNGTIFGSNGVLFEGATADTTEGILSPTVLTGDRTWTLPDTTGTLALASQMAPIGSAYVTVGNDGTLTAERAIAPGVGLTSTDGGANGSYTLAFDYSATLAASPALVAGQTVMGDESTPGLFFEGPTADGFEGLLTASPTASDKTWTLPDATGTIPLGTGTANYNAWSATNTLTSEQYVAIGRGAPRSGPLRRTASS